MSEINLSLNPNDPLVQHAFRGSSFAVVRLEELNEIANLKADAVACYRPANSQELFAIERIALCQQAILRGYRLESGLFTVALDCALDATCHTFRPMGEDLIGDGDIQITRAQNRNYAAGEGVRQMSIDSDVWALLIRYQVNADRQYRRAIEDFERVKRLRPEMPNQPGIEPKPESEGDLASFADLGRSYLAHRVPARPEPPPSGHSHTPPSPATVQPVTVIPSDLTPAASNRPIPVRLPGGRTAITAGGAAMNPHAAASPRAPLTFPVILGGKNLPRAANVQRPSGPRKTAHRHSELVRPPRPTPKAPVYHEVSGLSTAGSHPPGAAGIPAKRQSI